MINVTKTYLPSIDKYKLYVDQIFQRGWITNQGQLVQELEQLLMDTLEVDNLMVVANGTLALQIAFKALELQGEVITTPFSFVATTSSLVWEGLSPRFADIDRDTFCLNPANIEKQITDQTSAILPVHVFGNACDIEGIEEIAANNGLKTIYDAAHTFGSRYRGKSILAYGDISTISFHATKIFHTCEGGALVIRDDKIFQKAKQMLNFGYSPSDNYAINHVGINAKMNEFEAAMGLCVFDDLSEISRERKEIYFHYRDNLPNQLKLQKIDNDCEINFSYFPVVFESPEQLLKVKTALNSNDIFPKRYFYPSLETLCYLEPSHPMPVSREISTKILCLPLFAGLGINMADTIINIIKGEL